VFSGENFERHASGAEALVDIAGISARLKPCPFKAESFSATCKARIELVTLAASFDSARGQAVEVMWRIRRAEA
jgi:hypothetical protein